jgi:Flp pilus assembly protein TadG
MPEMDCDRFRLNCGGNTTVMFAVALPVLVAIAGAATMYVYEMRTQTALQAALDAGALAGTALMASASDEERIDAAFRVFAANFGTGGALVKGESDYVVTDGSPIPKFTVSNWEVSGVATATIDNPFSVFVGGKKLNIRVSATGAKRESEPICILGLNPIHEETIDMTGQPVLSAKGCAVQANSNSGSGMSQKGKPLLSAKVIGTTGGYTGDGYKPVPITGTVPIPDPYAELPFPDRDSCDFTDVKVKGSSQTLNPGVYCGGLRITAGGEAVLNPGIYIMKDGPLWINGGGAIRGTEVMIGFTGAGSTLYMEGNSSLDLTSPVSGTYTNMQFMQEPGTGGDDLWFGAVGNNTLKFDGALYVPTQDVWIGGGTVVTVSSPTYAIVADKIWVQDHSEVNVTLENKRNLDVTALGRIRYSARLIK